MPWEAARRFSCFFVQNLISPWLEVVVWACTGKPFERNLPSLQWSLFILPCWNFYLRTLVLDSKLAFLLKCVRISWLPTAVYMSYMQINKFGSPYNSESWEMRRVAHWSFIVFLSEKWNLTLWALARSSLSFFIRSCFSLISFSSFLRSYLRLCSMILLAWLKKKGDVCLRQRH